MAFTTASLLLASNSGRANLMTEEAKQQLVGFRWDEDRLQENERFRETLNKTELRKELFNEKFIEALEKRHDALAERQRKATLVTMSATLLLAIALLALNLPVSLFGISASNAANLREFLLVLLTSIPLYTLFGSIEQTGIADAMKTWISRASRGDKDVERVLRLRYGVAATIGLENLQRAGPEMIAWPKWRKIRVTIAFVGGLLWLLLTAGILFILEIWGLLSILIHPTVSFGFSLLVVVYVACALCVSYGMRAAAGIIGGSPETDK
jgi:hypothetical protein